MKTNKISLFNTQDSIRIGDIEIHIDSDGRYCLNDLHTASGGGKRHRPAYFLANTQTKELLPVITDAGIPASVLTIKCGANKHNESWNLK